mmetsp:Transcript_35929/g.98952  ORF Transcript_35929/g.98952 Transcript_35929/m.98952 type:complete len:237 (-) Transcript_35929:71-781(-)
MGGDGAFLLGARAVDHFVLALPHAMTLEEGVSWFEDLTGVRAAIGGRHVGRGTHNAVASLGSQAYIELLALDPEQPDGATWMGMETCPVRPRIVAWAARAVPGLVDSAGELDAMVQQARASGYEPGVVKKFARATPAGDELRWRLAFNHWRQPLPGGGVVPFLIAWDDGAPPPMETAPQGLSLRAFSATHPSPAAEVLPALQALGCDTFRVEADESVDAPCLELLLDTPKGPITLS